MTVGGMILHCNILIPTTLDHTDNFEHSYEIIRTTNTLYLCLKMFISIFLNVPKLSYFYKYTMYKHAV
jgi:hypothetical protein